MSHLIRDYMDNKIRITGPYKLIIVNLTHGYILIIRPNAVLGELVVIIEELKFKKIAARLIAEIKPFKTHRDNNKCGGETKTIL
jgi:hypothetical protein